MVRRLSTREWAGLLVCAASVALVGLFWHGRQSGPRAPALHDGPVYQNDQEGFRFLVPDGWTQDASGVIPPGTVEQEQMIVEYKLLTSDRPAALLVTRIDLPKGLYLHEYLRSHSPRPEAWRALGEGDPLTINGVEATRVTLRNSDATREVAAFRRGERVYLFIGEFETADTKAQQQIRRAVDSVIWKN
jgi:predicted Zn-dependent protease